MFLVDDLLTAPGHAVYFLIKELARKAQEEWLDDDSVKKELQEIYALLESGRISEEEFEAREVRLVERLQQIAMAKFQQAPTPDATPAALLPAESPGPPVASPPPPVVFEDAGPAIALEPAQIRTAILGEDSSFSSIAATLRPLLEMVGARHQGEGRHVETGLHVQPLDDLAAACASFGLTPTDPGEAPPPPPSAPQPAPAPAPTAPALPAPLPRPPSGALTIHQVMDAALGGLALLRLKVSAVTSVSRADDGWRVTAELVERRGVPDSSDLLGVYELRLDEAGNVLQWERTRLRRRCDLGSGGR